MTSADVLLCLLGYVSGSIPFGLLGGWCVGVDIRQHGSGNIGATNALRVCGAKVGAPVLLLDGLKGYLPVALLPAALASWNVGAVSPMGTVLAAVAAVIGHNFPVWLKFKGGKGVATSAGVMLALMPQAVGCALAAFAVTLAVWRYVSLSSTVAAVTLVVAWHAFAIAPYGADALPYTVLAWIMMCMVIIRHRSNYVRLYHGTESRIGKKTEAKA